jgi:hypothetical protein
MLPGLAWLLTRIGFVEPCVFPICKIPTSKKKTQEFKKTKQNKKQANKKKTKNHPVWWHKSLIPAFGRQKQAGLSSRPAWST